MNISFNANREARFEMPYNPLFDHTMGGIYGGVIASMIDNAGWFTAAAHTDKWISTANLTVQILQPAEKTLIR
jgi:acyl-coenzyme A thioesterase PaaI-like protein